MGDAQTLNYKCLRQLESRPDPAMQFRKFLFFGGNFSNYETPHPHTKQNVRPPASSLGNLLPTG